MALQAMAPSQRSGLHSTPSDVGPEAATQVWIKGSLLVASSGYVAEAGADPVDILGVAQEPSHNDAAAGTHDVGYTPALSHVIFEGNIDTSAAVGTGAIAATDRYAEYGVFQDPTTFHWYVDKNEAVNVKVIVLGFRDPVGTVQGRVYFKFIDSETIYN